MTLKRKSMYGLEVELFILNSEGKLVSRADELIKATEDKGYNTYVRKEYSKGMIELCAKENLSVKDCALAFMDNLEDLVELAEKMGYHLLPLGCHPGREMPKVRKSTWYDAQKAVVGKGLVNAGRTCGFHFHYTLPEGIVGKETKMIKTLGRSQARHIFLQQYNFLSAVDPAILSMCQSSPFWKGRHWGKDCRVIIYRNMKIMREGESLQGIYYYVPEFGGMLNYEFTLQDIRVMADEKKSQWLRMLEQKNFPTNVIAGHQTLKFMWGPLRVNKIGTFEYRGPDMNHPSIIFSASSLLMLILRAIESKELRVRPSDIGIDEPFVLEDDIIFLPPHATLKYLELQSAVRGFESKRMRIFCKNLLKLVDKVSDTKNLTNLDVVRKIVDKRKTVSDEILEMVKKSGFDIKKDIPEDVLNKIALYHADKLRKEFKETRKMLESYRICK